jgi:oligopeptide transport system substrate-binding protein
MMNKLSEKLLTAAAAVLLCSFSSAAQSADSSSDMIDPGLQHNFTIIDAPHAYDLDPRTASYSSDAQILTGLYEGLFSYDPVSLEPQQAIASSYRISRDKLRWTFTLRDDAKFSDGTPITAEDVRQSWLDLLAEPRASYSSLLDVVKGAAAYRTGKGSREDVAISASDSRTLSVHLASPASYLPRILCHSAFAVCRKGAAVYSGPFTLESYKDGVLVMKKNTCYWDADNTKLDQITVRQSADSGDNAFSFNTGDAQWIAGSADVKKLLNPDAVQVTAEFATEYLFFRCREGSVWGDAGFRNALLEAVPWDDLRKSSFVKAPTLVYPLSGYPQIDGFTYTDAGEAALLMKDARKKAGIAPDAELDLVFGIIDSEYMSGIVKTLSDAWAPLGVNVRIQKIPAEDYLSGMNDWQTDLMSYTWIGDFADPLAFLELFRGGSTLNVSGWSDKEYDSLLDEAALYTDENRMKLLGKAEQLLLDSGMIIPISHPVSLNIIDLTETGGWSSNAFDIHPLKYLFRRRKPVSVPNMI